jgi:WD40 repeat protein
MAVLDGPVTSPDKRRIASANRDGSVSVYDIETGNQLFVLDGHGAKVNGIAFGATGRLIATASADKTARLWNAESGAMVAVFASHTGPVTFVEFEDNDRSLITSSDDDGSLRRWSLPDGKLIAVFAGHERGVRRYASNYKARLIATASRQHIVRLWNIDTGQELARPDSEDAASVASRQITFTNLQFDEDGRRLLISRSAPQSEVVLWEVGASKAIGRYSKAAGLLNYFVGGGRLVLIQASNFLDEKAHMRLVDADDGRVIFDEGGNPRIEYSGERFVTSKLVGDNVPRLWDATTLQPIAELSGHAAPPFLVRFIDGGRQIVTASSDATIRLWSAQSGALLHVMQTVEVGLNDIKLASDERHAIVAGRDGDQIWDLTTAKVVSLEAADSKPVALRQTAFSPDGRRVAAHIADTQTVRVWDLKSGEEIKDSFFTDVSIPNSISDVGFNADGSRILATGDGSATILDVDKHTAVGTIIANPNSMSFSAGGGAIIVDGDKSAAFGDSGPTRIWRAAEIAGIFKDKSLTGHARYGAVGLPGSIAMLASTNETEALGASGAPIPASDNAIELVDVQQGRAIQTLSSDSSLHPVSVSADGSRVLTTSAENRVQVWDTATGKRLMESDEFTLSLGQSVALSQDGRRFCIASLQDGELTLTIWDVDAKSKLASTKIALDEQSKAGLISARFSGDNGQVALILSSFGGGTKVISVDAQTAATRSTESIEEADSMVVSPNANWFLFIANDAGGARARLINRGSGATAVFQLAERTHDAWFSPDERRVLTASSSGDVSVWDTATGSLADSFEVKLSDNLFESITCATVSPNGAFIAVGTHSGALYLYEIASRSVRKLSAGSSNPDIRREEIKGLAFSRDGHWLSVGGSESLVIRNIDTDPVVAAILTDSSLTHAMFTPNDNYLVSSGSDQSLSATTIHRMFQTPADLVEFARSRMPRCLTPIERKQYAIDPEPPLWCVEMDKWPYNTDAWRTWLDARKAGKGAELPADERFAIEAR